MFELLGSDSSLFTARLYGLLQRLSFSCGGFLLYLSVHLLGYAGEHLVCGCVCGGRGHDLGRRAFGEDNRAVGFAFFDLPFGVFTRGRLFELEGFHAPVFKPLLELADGCFRSRDGDGQVFRLHGFSGPGEGKNHDADNDGCQRGNGDNLAPG